jgi:hypothetical protein
VSIDLNTQYGSVADASTGDQTLVDFTNPLSPAPTVIAGLGLCPAANFLNMSAQLVNYNGGNHVLASSNSGGNCLGVESWPISNGSDQLAAANIDYGYATMPATPDGNPFVNGSDPNQFAVFNSVYNKKAYTVLVDGSQNGTQNDNQQWIAKIDLGGVLSCGISGANPPPILPAGVYLEGLFGSETACIPSIFLPTPSTAFTLSQSSISFGTVSVGQSSPQIAVTLANIGATQLLPQISLTGTNASDFSLQSSCQVSLSAQSNCVIDVMFTPTAAATVSSTTSASTCNATSPATTALTCSSGSTCLSVAVPGLCTQYVPLAGTGQ